MCSNMFIVSPQTSVSMIITHFDYINENDNYVDWSWLVLNQIPVWFLLQYISAG